MNNLIKFKYIINYKMNLLLLLVLVCVVALLKNCPYVPSVLKKHKQNLCWVAVILLVLCMTGMIEGYGPDDKHGDPRGASLSQ